MVKYTHLIERCSSFLRTGVAWKLKEHGYTFSEAYWRLRDGKGLLSSYDQESLKQWSSLITSVRRNTGSLSVLTPDDQRELKNKRESILVKREAYRDRLEKGSKPQYLHDGFPPIVMEHVLYFTIGDVRRLDSAQQQEIWENLDVETLKKNAIFCMKEIDEYKKLYDDAENKDKIPTPEEWTKRRFERTFVKDKVWQIRTGHDIRSSVNAGINERLNFIWNIPSRTNENHRAIYHNNMIILDAYQNWKNDANTIKLSYEFKLSTIHKTLESIKIPEFI